MTQEQKLQIIALHTKSKTLKEMVTESGLNSKEIEAFLAERGKKPIIEDKPAAEKKKPKGHHNFKATPKILAGMIKMHEQGYTYKQIADRVGCCPETVKARIKKAVGQEPPKEPKAVKKEQGESPVPTDDLLTEFKQLIKKIYDAAVECNLTDEMFTLTEGYKKLKTVVETVSKAEGETNG